MQESNTRRVADWYNAMVSSYDELHGEEQSRKYNRVLEFLGDRKFQLLVDIGCGTGAFFERAATHFDEAIGIDLSRRMLEKAKNRRVGHVGLILADASSLPIRDGIADCLTSVSVLESDLGILQQLEELRRVSMRPGNLILSLFAENETGAALELLKAKRWIELSKRETLYFIHIDSSPDQTAFPLLAGGL